MRRRRRSLGLLALLALPLVLLAGIWLGGHPSSLPGPIRDALVGDEEAQLVDEAFDIVEDDFYAPVDREKLVDRGLEGAVRGLDDRFSHYFDPKTYAEFARQTSGRFSGVGVEVQPDRRGLRVVRVIPGAPAGEAGIRRGDVIVRVNGRSIAGRPSDVATARIRGEAGTSVRLTLLRDERRRRVRVERADVPVEVVRSRMERLGGRRIAYVQLRQFSSGAHGEVGAAVRRLRERGAKGIVLDLRDNGGGLLEEAQLVASLFIEDGTIVSIDGRARAKRTLEATGGAVDTKSPLVVLVNRDTASASEIVAGAIQDRGRGELVGTRSFGKGVFQEVKQLSNGGALDITVGQYFLPSGRNLGGRGSRAGRGLRPDVRVADRPGRPGDETLRAGLRALAQEL